MILKPIVVVWSDISGWNGWCHPEELAFRNPSVCQRICYLLEETETHYKFMAGTSDKDLEDVCAMPKHNVLAIYPINFPPEVKSLMKKFEKGSIVDENDLKNIKKSGKKTKLEKNHDKTNITEVIIKNEKNNEEKRDKEKV